MEFDIVICYGPDDNDKINLMIEHTKQNVLGYRNIYIVSYDKDLKIDGCIIIDENIFGFNNAVKAYLGNNKRNGWYLQQLIKLHAAFVIDGILDNYLVIDTDTFFLKPTVFFDDSGLPLYNFGREHVYAYFTHMNKLHPSLYRVHEYKSGITHHMMFQKPVLQRLFDLVESHHQKKFYEVFLQNVHPYFVLTSGASEYEIYFNYLCIHEEGNFKLRQLKWGNIAWKALKNVPNNDMDYVSCHYWLQE